MAMMTAQEMFQHEVGDIYDAEHRFLTGQQEMLNKATDLQLQGLIRQHIEQTQQHIIRSLVLRVIFKTVALEPLCDIGAPIRRADLHSLRADRITELRQPPMRLPVSQEAVRVRQRKAGLRKGNISRRRRPPNARSATHQDRQQHHREPQQSHRR